MKQLQRILMLTLAILMALPVLPTQAMAEEAESVPVITEDGTLRLAEKASGICGENLTWTLSDAGTLTISGTGAMANYTTKHTYVNNQIKVSSTHPWGDWADSINKIVIGKGVTTIGDLAFYQMANVTSVTIPTTVTSIGAAAFEGCEGLTGVTIPGSVTFMGDLAFTGCKSLKNLTLSSGMTMIGAYAFRHCTSLTNVSVPDTVKSIGVAAFDSCSSLTSIKLPEGLDKIAFSTFDDCSSLKSITIPESVTAIEALAFSDCTGLTSITIPASVTSIGSSDDETPIKGETFSGCTALATIKFEGSAPEFWYRVFLGVTAKAYYPAEDTSWTSSVRQDYGGNITWVAEDAAPAKPYKIANVVSGVHVYWKATEGATKYGLWRSETGKNGTYKWVANPTVPHFTDTKVTSGKTYYYKVTSMSASGRHSAKSEAIGVTYVATPDITSRFNKAAGITLGWNKIQGATGYAIYRKSYSGNDAWVRVGTVSGNTTFTWQDTSVKNNNGTAYKYTVRALAGSDMKTLSGCRNAGRSMVRLTSRTLSSAVKASATSIKCSWNTSSAVTGYEVRFMVGSEVYKTFTVGNYKTGTKTFTGLKAGQTYKIQVRSYVKIDGMGFYSAWSEAKSVKLS